jgi:hypothetical protein
MSDKPQNIVGNTLRELRKEYPHKKFVIAKINDNGLLLNAIARPFDIDVQIVTPFPVSYDNYHLSPEISDPRYLDCQIVSIIKN